jgi:hypothetical protein
MPQMTITISPAKWATYKKYFLVVYPKQTDESDDEWVKHKILMLVKGIYKKGLQMEHEAGPPTPDEDIVEII